MQKQEQHEKNVQLNRLETKIAEQTLQLNKIKKKLSKIIETTTQGFLVVDKEALVLEMNPAMLTMLGRSSTEVIGMSLFDLVGEENRDCLYEIASLVKKGHNEGYDLKIPRPDGSICDCHLQVTLLLDESGEIEGSFALVSDIQDRLKLEQNLKAAKMEAEQSSAAKILLLSSMSHEFRTPMNSILGFAQLLDDDDSLGSKQKNFVAKILESGDYLKGLINDILDFAKIEAGVVSINITTVDLCQLIDEIVNMVTPEVQAREIEFLIREPDTHYLVKVDPLRLQQVITNLISNAIKYSFAGGQIELFCEKNEAMKLRLHIVDNGPGIPEDKLEQLFTPFNRLGAETSTIQGAGLGLAISKNLAEMMDCSLGFLEKSGAGCDFYIDLPLAELETVIEGKEGKLGNEVANSNNDNFKPCTLLYIEDDELNRTLMESIIEQRLSITLLSAVNGRQGVEMAVKEQPDIVMTDIGLPDIDGNRVLSELQNHSQTKAIPVIALSGNAAAVDIKNALAAGFAAYLTKPFNIGQLFATIDEVLTKINYRG